MICLTSSSGQVTEVETQTERAEDVSEVVHAPDPENEKENQTPSAGGNGRLDGAIDLRAHL